jgi:protein-tyrosine phosphatase
MKVLMVCLGNICRSPLAHGIMEALAKEHGLDWEIDSAGTGGWHVGSQPDRRSIAIAKKYGVDISGQRCRQFSAEDFDRYDLILVMDHSNLEDVLARARTVSDRSKVRLLRNNDIVPDPYYDDEQFDPVYRLIDEACREIILEHRANTP